MAIPSTSYTNFSRDVKKASGQVLVYFYDPACPSYALQIPILESMKNITAYSVNSTTQRKLVGNHNLYSVPAFALYRAGTLVATLYGIRSQHELQEFMNMKVEEE